MDGKSLAVGWDMTSARLFRVCRRSAVGADHARPSPPKLSEKIPSSSTESGNAGVAMAPSLSSIGVLVLYVILSPCVSGDDCLCYTEWSPWFHFRIALSSFWSCQKCFTQFCCGDCYNRYCCSDPFRRFDKDHQELCLNTVHMLSLPTAIAAVSIFLALISMVIVTCCCVCPSCFLYKRFCQPCYLITTTTHPTVEPITPHQYPQQPIVIPGPKSYQRMPHHSVPTQPGYPVQAIPMSPPSYQEAISSANPPQPMPYS